MTDAVRARIPEDDAAIVALMNRCNPEFLPEDVTQLRYFMTHKPQNSIHEWFVTERDGDVVAAALLRERWGTRDDGVFYGSVTVDRNCRGQGVGSRLYERILSRARECGARRLYSSVRDDCPEACMFATRRGYSRTGRVHRLSYLTVSTVNLDGFDLVEEQLRARGIRIVTLAEMGPHDEATLHRVHVLSDRTAADMPASEPRRAIPCDLWHGDVLHGPGMSPEWFWVALDGDEPVGLASMQRHGESAAVNDFTGVDGSYRGRGIARALKLRTVQWARDAGIDRIYTANDEKNHRMLSINVSMGYTPLPTVSEVTKELQ